MDPETQDKLIMLREYIREWRSKVIGEIDDPEVFYTPEDVIFIFDKLLQQTCFLRDPKVTFIKMVRNLWPGRKATEA